MNHRIPSYHQFRFVAVDEVSLTGSNEELKFSVEVTPRSMTNRIAVGLVDRANQRGMVVGVYPATGEVCDIVNGGGVLGYLERAPLNPNQPVFCELKMFRFGRNFVCNACIAGENFLYPAFSHESLLPMAVVIGKELYNGDTHFSWDHLTIEVHELSGVIAA